MRILVTGSRAWSDWRVIRHALTQIAEAFMGEPVTLVHGGAQGADAMAADTASRLGWEVEEHRAHWRPNGIYNARAGLDRNQRMIDTLTVGVDMVIAFHMGGSTGTAHCITKAREAGFDPIIFLEEV